MTPMPGKCAQCKRRVFWFLGAWRNTVDLNHWGHAESRHRCRR